MSTDKPHRPQPPATLSKGSGTGRQGTSFVRPDVFRQLQEAGSLASTLNLKPTLWFAAPVAMFFALTSTFLEVYVVDAIASAHLAVFAVGSYIVVRVSRSLCMRCGCF